MWRPISLTCILAFLFDYKLAGAFSLMNLHGSRHVHTARETSPAGGGSLLSISSIRDSGRIALFMATKPPAFKGFGKAPEAPFDRVPESADEPCICESGKAYKNCCQPFHAGKEWPSTPEQLMRSRCR